MSIWSKVLVGVILAATLPFFYLAMRALKTNQAWRSGVNAYQKALLETEQGNPAAGRPSIEGLAKTVREQKVVLHELLVDRGRAWVNVNPAKPFDAATGEGSVQIENPTPHRITPNLVLYAFAPDGFLGQFRVTAAADKTATLAPNMKMSERQLKRLAASVGDWTLYEVMPADRHEAFAGLDKAALEALLPAESVGEYVKDGQPAEANDPPQRVVDGKYERPLTDYGVLFHELDRQLSVQLDLYAAAEKDTAAVEGAVADAKEQVKFHQAEIAELKTELEKSRAEQALVTAQRKALATQLAAVRADIKSAFQENRKLAAEWTETQLRAAEQADAAAR